MSMCLDVRLRPWIGGAVLLFFAGWMISCSSIRPDFVYQSPFVRVYPVDDSTAVPPKTKDRYLAKEQLKAVDLDTVNVKVFGQNERLRPYHQVAILHLTMSEAMYAYNLGERDAKMHDLLRKAAAIVGSDAVVVLRRETNREDETVADDDRGRDPRTVDGTGPGDADRSREEWRDDWRESRRYSIRAVALRWKEDREKG